MGKIKFKDTDPIREVLEFYRKAQKKNSDVLDSFLISAESQGWLYTFGLTYKECFIDGMDYPQACGLSQAYRGCLEDRESHESDYAKRKKNWDFFQDAYNTCYHYIADNQTRNFGWADLNNLSHPKVFAMVLIAHLCKKAMMATLEDQETYKQRICDFSVALLTKPEIRSSSSQDDFTLSCASALDRIIRSTQGSKESDQEERLAELLSAVKASLNALDRTLTQVNDCSLSLLTGQNTIDSHALKTLPQRDSQAQVLTQVEQRLLNNPLIQDLYFKPWADLEDLSIQQDLYTGHDYSLNFADSFLLNHFDETQKANLKRLLQVRDRLSVLQRYLSDLHGFVAQNQIAFLNEFLHLVEPYLKEIHRNKGELQACFEHFDLDCAKVYRLRQNHQGWFAEPGRADWETSYLNKRLSQALREGLVQLSSTISKAFAVIPFDYFSSLEGISQGFETFMQVGKVLFGGDFSRVNSQFQRTIDEAQKHELERQADLILLKQESLLQEYEQLIKKVKTSPESEQRDQLLALLVQRRNLISGLIQNLNEPSQALSQSKDPKGKEGEEANLLLSEINTSSFVLMKEEQQADGFFNLVWNYLRAPSVQAFEELTERLVTANEEIAKLSKLRDVLEQENKNLKENLAEREDKVTALRKELEALKEKKEEGDKYLAQAHFAIEVNNCHRLMNGINPLEASKLSTAMLRIVADGNVSREKLEDLRARVEKVETLVLNLNALMRQNGQYIDAYKRFAGGYDNSYFFSHNQNGKRHAEAVRRDFIMEINRGLGDILRSEKIRDENGGLKDNFDEVFAEELGKVLESAISGLSARETYSSYKQHSLRNYLYHFHNQFLDEDNKLKFNLLERGVVEGCDLDTIENHLKSQEFIGEERLRAFREALPGVEAEKSFFSAWGL